MRGQSLLNLYTQGIFSLETLQLWEERDRIIQWHHSIRKDRDSHLRRQLKNIQLKFERWKQDAARS